MRKPDYINPYKMFIGLFTPNWLAERKECSPGAKLMYGRLSQYAGEKGYCWPSHDELSQALGVSSRQVRTYITELIRLKLIIKERVGFKKSNRYYFRKHPWQKADVKPPERDKKASAESDRKDTSTQDRKDPSTHDRKDPSTHDRKFSVIDHAVAPSATKPSRRRRESVVRESSEENQTTTPLPPTSAEMTPSAPKSTDVVEVGQPVAVAQGEETTTTDGIIAAQFQAFITKYPNRCGNPDEAKAVFIALNPDDALYATLMSALALWDTLWAQSGYQKVPLAVNWLQRRWWEDKRVRPKARRPSQDWPDEAADDGCKVDGCERPIDTKLSDVRCSDHIMEKLTGEAETFLTIMNGRDYEEHYGNDTPETRGERALKLVDRYHPEPKGCALAVLRCLNSHYGQAGPCIEASFLAHRIAEVVRGARGYPMPTPTLTI